MNARVSRRALFTAVGLVAVATGACGTVLTIEADGPEPAPVSPDGASDDPADDGPSDTSVLEAFDAPRDAPTEATLALPQKVVFMMRTALTPGIEVKDGTMMGHVARGAFDTRCQNEASSAGLGGKFLAFMSMKGSAPPDAIDRISNGFAWYLPPTASDGDGGALTDLVFDDRAYIATGIGPRIAITRGADGNEVTAAALGIVWTGSTAAGVLLTVADCSAWSVGGNLGRYGIFGASGHPAISAANGNCTVSGHAICMQQ